MLEANTQILNLDKLLKDFRDFVPPRLKKRALQQMGRAAVAVNRKRLRRQENLDGGGFEPGKAGGKVLTKMLKEKTSGGRRTYRLRQSSDESLTVESLVPFAREHHEGHSYTVEWEKQKKSLLKMRGKRMGREKNNESLIVPDVPPQYFNHPCTKEQAKYLAENWDEIWDDVEFDESAKNKRDKKRLENDRVKLKNGKRWLKVTAAKLQKMYTMGQAGYFIRSHRVAVGSVSGNKSWKVVLPERHVLGLSPEEQRLMALKFKTVIAKNSYFSMLKNTSLADSQRYESFLKNYLGE